MRQSTELRELVLSFPRPANRDLHVARPSNALIARAGLIIVWSSAHTTRGLR